MSCNHKTPRKISGKCNVRTEGQSCRQQHASEDNTGTPLRFGSLGKELLPLLVVLPLPVHQLLVTSLLLHSTLTHNSNLICPLNGLQPVSDNQQGLVGTKRQGLLNLRGVGDRTRCSVNCPCVMRRARPWNRHSLYAVPDFRREHPDCW